MSTDLSLKNQNTEIEVLQSKWTEEDYDAVKGSSGFLPALVLFTGGSDAVKEEKIGMNRYGLRRSADDIEDLGKEVDVLIINRRPRALDLSDKSNIRASFDPKSELFNEIKERAQNVQNSNCMFGMEFLVYIPNKGYATFFMGSATARNESRKVNELLGRKATLKSRKIEGSNGYIWFGPLTTPCSALFDLPDPDEVRKIQEEFLDPKEMPGKEKIEQGVQPAVER